jgi:hypothetical protein
MKALVITEVGQTEIHDIAAPKPGNGEVLIAVQHVGLCGSDLNTYSALIRWFSCRAFPATKSVARLLNLALMSRQILKLALPLSSFHIRPAANARPAVPAARTPAATTGR